MHQTDQAQQLATELVASMGTRWEHLRTVGTVAEHLAALTPTVTDIVVDAAWLHDIGYSPAIAATGFHPLDGARYLMEEGFDAAVVALVAHHTGAVFEAEQRGLEAKLAELPVPSPVELDILTMIDLSVGPNGKRVVDVDRIAEILERYQPGHPVHEAVTRSRPSLLASSARAKQLLGLPKTWPTYAKVASPAQG